MIEVQHYTARTGEDLRNLLRGGYLILRGKRIENFNGTEQYEGIGKSSIIVGISHMLMIGEPEEINETREILEKKLLTKLKRISH